MKGEIISVGTGARTIMEKIPMDVKAGDKVLFGNGLARGKN